MRGFPQPFGDYELLEPLKQGGMGEVFVARSKGLAGAERLCVLKTVRPDRLEDEAAVARFRDEAALVIHLRHANISHVFDAGEADGKLYMAMELVEGIDVYELSTRAAAEGSPIPEPVALHIATEVLAGLDYAHRASHPIKESPLAVVHRDISPPNIMITNDGGVKVIDFGLAASTRKKSRTLNDLPIGKLTYMSPEQVAGKPLDGKTDQFSASIVIYELLTQERFYGDLTSTEVWLRAAAGYVPPGLENLDEKLREILRRGLAPDPDKRWADCGQMRDAIGTELTLRYGGTSRRRAREFVKVLNAGAITSLRARAGTDPRAHLSLLKSGWDTPSDDGKSVDLDLDDTTDDQSIDEMVLGSEPTSEVDVEVPRQWPPSDESVGICSSCKAELPEGATFCPSCGVSTVFS